MEFKIVEVRALVLFVWPQAIILKIITLGRVLQAFDLWSGRDLRFIYIRKIRKGKVHCYMDE